MKRYGNYDKIPNREIALAAFDRLRREKGRMPH